MPHQGFSPFPWRTGAQRRLQVRIGGDHSWLLVERPKGAPASVLVPERGQALGQRLEALLSFCDGAALCTPGSGSLRVQLLDEGPDDACFRFDAPVDGDDGGPLIPDPYCLMSAGYQQLRAAFSNQPLPQWSQRLPMAFWRGSSTGTPVLDPSTLPTNLRYQLCLQSLKYPQWLDARFSGVVQCPHPQAQSAVITHLRQHDLLRPRVSPWHAALHRWLLEIDGNVNSWGLLWKLLSGSCVVRVESSRRQWYHRRLQPWVHVVPVAADLNNLGARLEWCVQNPEACYGIAAAGQRLAYQVVTELGQDLLSACEAYGLTH